MDFKENKPIYLQLADKVMDDLAAGYSRDDGRLPSVRDYAVQTGVNVNTVMRTYAWLQQNDVIFNRRGIGYFFADDAAERVRIMRRKKFFGSEMAYFMERLSALGISPDELSALYREWLDTHRH